MKTMRLFIAVNFPGSVKKQIADISSQICDVVSGGNPTSKENYHLTLAFLGEVAETKQRSVEKAMESVSFEPFALTIKGVGRFKRNGGDIVWLGIEKTSTLMSLQKDLSKELSKIGFEPDRKNFEPHLTLGREMKIGSTWKEIEKIAGAAEMTVPVEKISLMRSERISEKLIYTEIYSKKAD